MADDKIEMAGDDERFAENVKLLREGLGWSQGELARRMKEAGWTAFHQTTISRIEKGDRPVKIGEARAIAKVLGTLVGLMIAPSKQAVPLQELATALDDFEAACSGVRGAVNDFYGARAALQFQRSKTEEAGTSGFTEPGMVERLELLMARVDRAINCSISEVVNEAVEDSAGLIRFGSSERGADDASS